MEHVEEQRKCGHVEMALNLEVSEQGGHFRDAAAVASHSACSRHRASATSGQRVRHRSSEEDRRHPGTRGPKDHINIRILPNIISGIPFYWALGPKCEILMFMRSYGGLRMELVGIRKCHVRLQVAVWYIHTCSI